MRIVSLFLVLALFGALSCSKEKSFEIGTASRGSLQSSTTGECLTKVVAGSFIAGAALTDSNYVEVEVDVTTAGAYTIATDAENGYSFSGSGNFTQTGINRVRLAATGTPAVAGENSFTVVYDTTQCDFSVTVLPAGSNSGPAAFTLQGTGDSCMDADVQGAYTAGKALDGANKVTIKVNVTTVGTYTVNTDTVNGFSFSGTGTLASAGSDQIITLIATGTPAAGVPTPFTVTAGSTTCAFLVNVFAGDTSVITGDLFPLSANSYWTYDVTVPNAFSDTSYRENAGTGTVNGVTYSAFIQSLTGNSDTSLYRKSGDNYYTVGPVDAFVQIQLDTLQYAETVFLKEGLRVGETWSTDEFTGTEEGKPVTIKYIYTCTEANTTATVNEKLYSNVYVINQQVDATVDGAPYVPEGGESGANGYTFYYARGIGLIQTISQLGGVNDLEIKIRYYNVN